MPAPERIKIATADARLQWLVTDDGSRTLWDSQLDETYHSGCGAVAESLVVYLVNSGVLTRLQQALPTRVLEYGFGTGTAFLLTAAAAELYDTPLTYRGLELELLPVEIFASLELAGVGLDREPLNAGSSAELLSQLLATLLVKAQRLISEFTTWRSSLPAHPPQGIYVWSPSRNVRLELVIGDAVDYDRGDSESFNAVYFDPFSPASAPQLWSERVFRTAYESLHDRSIAYLHIRMHSNNQMFPSNYRKTCAVHLPRQICTDCWPFVHSKPVKA